MFHFEPEDIAWMRESISKGKPFTIGELSGLTSSDWILTNWLIRDSVADTFFRIENEHDTIRYCILIRGTVVAWYGGMGWLYVPQWCISTHNVKLAEAVHIYEPTIKAITNEAIAKHNPVPPPCEVVSESNE